MRNARNNQNSVSRAKLNNSAIDSLPWSRTLRQATSRGASSSKGHPVAALGFHSLQVFGELERQPRSFFHLALHGLLITAQHVAFARLPQIAGFNIQEQLDLPRPEGVAVHIAAKQFLDQAVKLRQHCVAIW